jgi:ribosomal protein S13
MPENELLMLLTGPVSALALAVTMLLGIGRLVSKYVPKVIEKHLNQIDEQMKTNGLIVDRLDQLKDSIADQHAVQTEATRKAIAGLHGRLNPMENDLKEVKTILRLETRHSKQQPNSMENYNGL